MLYSSEKKYSKHFIEREYGISRKTQRDWQLIKDKILEITDNNRYRLYGGGRKSSSIDKELEILDWIKFNRNQGIAISVRSLIGFAISIINEFKNKKYKTLVSWAHRFMKRNNLTIRMSSHIGQKITSRGEMQLLKFLKDIIAKPNCLDIFDDLERIINVDESPIYLEMPPKKTIEIKGSKNVDIYTFGKEKQRITCVLSIAANGTKLPPLLIFKGKAGKYLEKN